MAINASKVVVGGLAAGVVLNVIDFITNKWILGSRMAAEMNAAVPGLADRMMGKGAMITYIVVDFLIGILLVWLYAAIRPRFGPGPRTAFYAALFAWVFGSIIYYSWVLSGLMMFGTYAIGGIIALINFGLATWLGARLYTEGATAPMA